MMGRGTPWLLALACVLAGGGLWFYRDRQVRAETRREAEDLVRSAWSEGRRVALSGRQRIEMTAPGGRSTTVEARVLTSSAGYIHIEYLTDPLRGVTVWEGSGGTYRFNPKLHRLTVAKTQDTFEAQAGRERRLLRNYTARLAGEERVAGRQALVVDLRPRSGGDRWKRVAIDPVTSVVLLNEDRRGKTAVLRRTRFTEIEYPPADPPADAFQPPAELVSGVGAAGAGDASHRYEAEALSGIIGFKVRQPAWLSRGYGFTGAYQVRCGCPRKHFSARLEYSDGLNTISLFQCGHPKCRSKGNCFGADGDSPMAVHYESGGVSYLAVGEIPQGDLRHMLRSASGE